MNYYFRAYETHFGGLWIFVGYLIQRAYSRLSLRILISLWEKPLQIFKQVALIAFFVLGFLVFLWYRPPLILCHLHFTQGGKSFRDRWLLRLFLILYFCWFSISSRCSDFCESGGRRVINKLRNFFFLVRIFLKKILILLLRVNMWPR